ncbi:hypothetical protein HOD08_02910 [bacterium]|nr:hypothetical protein [bacterium]
MKNKSIFISTLATIALTICSNMSTNAATIELHCISPAGQIISWEEKWSTDFELIEIIKVEVLKNHRSVGAVVVENQQEYDAINNILEEASRANQPIQGEIIIYKSESATTTEITNLRKRKDWSGNEGSNELRNIRRKF